MTSGFVLGLRLLLAVVLAVAGIAKLADRDGSAAALEGFGTPTRLARPGGVVLALFEVAIAVSLLVGGVAWWGLLAATGLLALFTVMIGLTMTRGTATDCHCFGQLHSAPVGWRTLARTGTLAAVGGVAVVAAPRAAHTSLVGWIAELSAPEVAAIAIAALLLMVIVAQGWFLFELFRQHGRVLTRLELLEHELGVARRLPADKDPHLRSSAVNATDNNGHTAGLAVGSPAPEFTLPSVAGHVTSLSDLRARGAAAVLLVFSDPACGPCSALLPDIADWQHRLSDRLTIALVSTGGVEENLLKAREHQLSDVLVQNDREVASRYQAHGTPSALLISVDGRIASHLARGSEAIEALVERPSGKRVEVIGPPGTSSGPGTIVGVPRIHGPVVGAEAPNLTWRDIDGRTISLHELRGNPVAILFWNPGCGFCQRVLPDLKAWEDVAVNGVPRLLVISTGTPDENRALGLRSPLIVEHRFETGRMLGASGTPSAVVISGSGRFATPVARGGPSVLTLLRGLGPNVIA